MTPSGWRLARFGWREAGGLDAPRLRPFGYDAPLGTGRNKGFNAMHFVDAANAMTPAYLTILSKGYSVERRGDLMVAERKGSSFAAAGPVALLGLIAIAEARGETWQATDGEIDEFVARFG